MKVKQPCSSCFGQKPYCTTCEGRGFIIVESAIDRLLPGSCSYCQGKGFKIIDGNKTEMCSVCLGTGKIKK